MCPPTGVKTYHSVHPVENDSASTSFQAHNSVVLMRRLNTHDEIIKKSTTLSDTVKPVTFTREVKWLDWVPSFINYMCTIPGRYGHPLKYIYRESNASDPTPSIDFLDEYVVMVPLIVEA